MLKDRRNPGRYKHAFLLRKSFRCTVSGSRCHLAHCGPVFYFVASMAKQSGAIILSGNFEGLCFYESEGQPLVRRQSSLSGERFRIDPAFAGSRRSAGLLAEASPIASFLYHRLPPEEKGRSVFQRITGQVKLLLAAGQDQKAIEAWFAETYPR